MKNLLLVPIILLLACSESKNMVDKEIPASTTSKHPEVKIRLTITGAHCGGAAPSEERMKKLRTPEPHSNARVYLRKGTTNNIEENVEYMFQSDDDGLIVASLPEGKYSIVFEDKSTQEKWDQLIKKYGQRTDTRSAIDQECLKKYFSKPEAILEVTKGGKNEVTVNKAETCPWTSVPCSQYFGPLPP